MLRCQFPAPLQPGDLLHVIAPSGALREIELFHRGVELWRSQGYRVELPPSYDRRWGYLAGTDEDRRIQLAAAWNDPACRGVLCARGGYGSMRLLEDWTWKIDEPKWVIGFSDITGLLWSLAVQGIAGIHGPLLTTLSAEPAWSQQRLWDCVQGHSLAPIKGEKWAGGTATGLLLPANLTVATHLLHTPHMPDLDGVILAIEDVSEAPYRVDRMLTQWRLCGALSKVRGVAIGRFSQCEPPTNIPSFTVEGVLRDRFCDLGIPVVAALPFGHDGENAALPVGVPVVLDGDRAELRFES
ncbi:S66 peptidase family protein [Leptolyngbya sp. AN02str]|uniref:S66 peptidase family protein n=1 Tax=Leptolyngbya sp. AN02str TaxID=3423363 RepID=UPI003D3240FD